MNVIKNCPVTSDHVDIAEKIFGTDVATLKGKTAKKQTPKVLEDTVDVPEELYKLNDQLELYMPLIDQCKHNEQTYGAPRHNGRVGVPIIDKLQRLVASGTQPSLVSGYFSNRIAFLLHGPNHWYRNFV